jgi:ribosome biogenesis GTPase A
VFEVKDGSLAEIIFEKIARKRGCLLSGGLIDGERAAALILDEFRSGTLGKVTLEKKRFLNR